jgi:hypothetical protein
MTPAKKSEDKASFTIDELIAESNGILRRAKKQREDYEAPHFVCAFRDRTGVITGQCHEQDERIQNLSIFGKGPSWKAVVKTAIAMAATNERISAQVIEKLSPFTARGDRRDAFHCDIADFNLVRFPDGQMLFTITLPQKEEVDKRTYLVAVAPDGGVMMPMRFPSLGMELTVFKTELLKRLTAAGVEPEVREEQIPGQLLVNISISACTAVAGGAGDGKNLSHVMIMAMKTNKASEFWLGLETAIAALSPGISKSAIDTITAALGRKESKNLPRYHEYYDDGRFRYMYHSMYGRATLSIHPSHCE